VIRAFRENPELRDSRNFLCLAWRHLLRMDPTPIQYDVVHFLATGPPRLVAKGFRGMGKSWIASVYVCWEWGMDENVKALIVSGGARRAADFTTFTRQLIESWDALKDLRPRIDALRDSKIQFDVGGTKIAHAASMTSIGITGQLTGNRANVIIADDVETQANSDTPAKRERVEAYVREFGSILSPRGRIRVLGTDHTEESLYRTLPAKGYTVRCWPAEYPAADLKAALGDSLAPQLRETLELHPERVGQPTEPTRFPDEELRAKEAELGRSHYRLQFLLDPRMSDMERFPLRLSDLIVMPLDPEAAPERVTYGGKHVAELPCLGFSGDRYLGPSFVAERWLPYQGKVLAVDPAGRGKDETVAAVLGQLNGYLFLLELRAWLGEGYSDTVLAAIADMAARQRVGFCVAEANFGDGMFARLLEPHLHRSGHHCAVEEVRHAIQKERRIIDTLEPVMQQHRLVVDQRVLLEDLRPIPGLAENAQFPYRLAHQLSRITRDKGSLQRDDRIDAVAIGAAYWKDALAQDARRRQAEVNDKAMHDEVRRFLDHALSPARWRGEQSGWLDRSLGREERQGWRRQSRRSSEQ